ncbi:MAG TPA: hypothetical protein PKZ16_03320 [bacterium]|nr:hypothetical protein [bacterium]HPL95374.1 hypothetical protein [bacterium]
MKRLLTSQLILLLIGTLFAWTNFIIELIHWLNQTTNQLGCFTATKNPFLTPCFYGAIFFTLAFILSVISVKKFTHIEDKK